jgi:hypothetical protein
MKNDTNIGSCYLNDYGAIQIADAVKYNQQLQQLRLGEGLSKCMICDDSLNANIFPYDQIGTIYLAMAQSL